MRRRSPRDGVPDALWRRVARAPHALLMLDYDGTLAPFTAARDEARPLPGSIAALRRIAAATRTSVAIVSGRPLRDVERLVGPIPAAVVGEHGWECRGPDGGLVQIALDPRVAQAIAEAERRARAFGWGGRLERKRSAIVLHTRSLPGVEARSLEERCVEAWRDLARPRRAIVDRIDGGVELRAYGRNKGTVVRSLLSRCPPDTLGVFVGDDVTDEDAFEAVRDRGFGVRVGERERASKAAARLRSCEAVTEFLEKWLEVAGSAAPAAP